MARMIRMTALVALAGLACGGATIALAAEPDALAGPKVQQQAGSGQQFAPGANKDQGRRDRMGQALEQGSFLRAVRWLGGPEAPADIKLSEQQQQQVRAAVEQFEVQVREYRTAHRAEVEQLAADLPEHMRERVLRMLDGPRGDMGEQGGPREGRRPQRPDGPGPQARGEREPLSEQAQIAMEKLRTIREQGPKPESMHAAVSAVLTDAQRKAVQARIDEQAKQRLERLEKARNGAGQGRDGGRDGERVRALRDRLTPEQREKLRTMTPDERRAFLRDLLEREGDQMGNPR